MHGGREEVTAAITAALDAKDQERDAAILDKQEAEAKQRIDERQCDEATRVAADLAHKLTAAEAERDRLRAWIATVAQMDAGAAGVRAISEVIDGASAALQGE